VIVAFGLIRGGDGWRAFACFRAGFGLLLGFYSAFGLSSPYYGWFNALWCIGFLVLLWGKKASSRRRIAGTTLVAGGQVALLAVSLFAIIPEYRLRSAIQSYSLPTKTVSDQDLGYAITIPSGWTVLKKDNPILNLPDAKMIAVNVRSGEFVAFLAELPTAGLRSPDNYLDQVEKGIIKDQPSTHFRELRRTDILIDGSAWRKAEVEWQESGEELSGVFLVVRRGWLFYSLRGWSGKALKSRAEESFLDMQHAVKISPEEPNEKFTVGFITGLQTKNPLISERAARQLVEAASARGYTVTELSQLSETAVEKGRPGLTPAEQNELDALYMRALATLSDAEKRTLSSYYDQLNAGQKVDPSEAQTAEKLVLKGVRNLPESVQVQFRMVFSKMVESGLTRLE